MKKGVAFSQIEGAKDLKRCHPAVHLRKTSAKPHIHDM